MFELVVGLDRWVYRETVAAAGERLRSVEPEALVTAGTLGPMHVSLRIESRMTAVVLVEGVSDRIALETLAARRGRDLDAEGVSIAPIGGAQAIGNVLRLVRAQGPEIALAGLCDAREEPSFRRALEDAGLGGRSLTREAMEALGFFVCEPDLEAELIRALGVGAVERVLERGGNLSAFRTFQKQPQWEGRRPEDQLRRFFGSSAGKIKYARLLVEALDLSRVPRPLDGVLAYV